MEIAAIIRQLEAFAPPGFQEPYDNSGLITGDVGEECTGVLVCLDCTENTIREAVQRKCNLIVSHHPLIFRPIRQIIPSDDTGKALITAIRSNVAIYAIHTNLDNVIRGVNDAIASKIGLINRRILLQKDGNPGVGSGIVGELPAAVSETDLLKSLQLRFKVPVIRHSPLTGKPVRRIAVCGGAGSFLIFNALQENADFFITADLKYHEFFNGQGKMVIADIGHFESEQFTIDLIHDVILEKFPNFAVLKSGTVTNPVNYYI